MGTIIKNKRYNGTFFNKYAEDKPGLGKNITGKGLQQFCMDFNVGNKYNPSNALTVFTFYCDTQRKGCINYDEFCQGLAKCKNPQNMNSLIKSIPYLESVWDDKALWTDVGGFYYKL